MQLNAKSKLILVLFFSVLSNGCSFSENISDNSNISYELIENDEIIKNAENYKIDKNQYFEIIYADMMYYYFLYDKNHNVVKSDGPLIREPHISMVDEYLVKFTLQSGTGLSTQWGFYYDVENDIFSETFYSIFGQSDGKMIYREKEKVIVRDIFDKGRYYQEFSEFSNPLSETTEPFVNVEFINNGESIEVTYLTGDDYRKVTEIFDLI